jgi:hypothetical protein
MMRTLHERSDEDRDAAQMLLATGVVLLMSLLSMAIFGVKVAGMTMPYDTQLWIDGGLGPLEAGETAFQSVHDDILHHGELRGIEIKLIDMQVNETSANTLHFEAELGISDGSAMLTVPLSFDITHA